MQNHTLKFSEWLEQRDPELFIEINMNRRGFLGTVGAAATSMVGNKVLGNDDEDEDNIDYCEKLKDAEKRLLKVEFDLASFDFNTPLTRTVDFEKIRNKHKSFTDSKVGKEYKTNFVDPHGTIHNPYKSTTVGMASSFEEKLEYQNHIEYIKNQKNNDLKLIKWYEDKIKNLKKTPTPKNQEEIQHYEKIIDIYNHTIKNGPSAKPKKDHHPHEDYYADMKSMQQVDAQHKSLLSSLADLKAERKELESSIQNIRDFCERKIDKIIYQKLKSQHGENTLNISPKDTLYILKHGSKGEAGKLKELAEELGKSNIERLNLKQSYELVNRPFESGEYFKTLINILGSEKIKNSIVENQTYKMSNIEVDVLGYIFRFVRDSYDNYLQDVFDFIIGRRNLINLPVQKIFKILYYANFISLTGRLEDSHEKYISIIIKNIGMHNMAKLGKAHWSDLEKDFKNKYGDNIIKKVYEKMRPKTYSPSIFGE